MGGVYPIQESLFSRTHFSNCLAQPEIETYNQAVGNANFVINLYNQAKNNEPGFKRLSIFKTLYKQIGCGEGKALFFALTHQKKSDVERPKQQGVDTKTVSSVEEVLDLAKAAGGQYFVAAGDDQKATIPAFVAYVTSPRENYLGFYWSKVALNTISGKYFANWHDLKDRLKQAAIFKKGGKDDTEDIKIPEVVELQGFFEVLNATSDWQKTLFKESLLEDKKRLIELAASASEALLAMIASDITGHAQNFLDRAAEIESLTKNYFSLPDSDKTKGQAQKEWKEAIKAWIDEALAVNRILKYFQVRESKVKGTPIDSRLSEMLKSLLYAEDAEWFKWYPTKLSDKKAAGRCEGE